MLYSKPYSKTIDALRMPKGYQPPKFMQFDGKGNPKQHDKRLSIVHHGKKEPITDFKMFTPKVDKTGKEPAKEAPTISITPVKASYAPVKIASKNKVKEIKKDEPFRTQDRYKNTLRELEQKTYPFPDSDMAAMLDDLLEKKVIELPECKRPKEMHHDNDPKYCKYHRIVGHPVGKCFTLKTLIMKLAQQGRIELNLEDTTAKHTTTIVFGSFDPVPLQMIHDHSRQSSSHTAPSAQPPLGASDQNAPTNDEEGWTLVTYREKRKPRPQAARHTATIMFGSFKSVPLQRTHDRSCQSSSHKAPSAQPPLGASDQDAPTNEEEGWTSATCKRTRKPRPQATKPKAEQGRKHHCRNKRKSKRSAKAAKPTYGGELMEQEPRIPVSLHEYFPNDFFRQCTTASCHMVKVEIEGPSKGKAIAAEEGETLMPEKGLPTHYNIKQNREEPKPAPRRSVFEKMNHSRPRNSALDHIGGSNQTSVFKRLSMPTIQNSVFERLSKPKKQSGIASSLPRRSALDRLEETEKSSKRRKTTLEGEKLDGLAERCDVRSSISSKTKHQLERGQSSSGQPPEQSESVGDKETSTQRWFIPVTMGDLFPEDFFDYSAKAPCYEDCEDRLSYTT